MINKAILLLCVTLMVTLSTLGQPSNVNGTIDPNISQKVVLFKVHNGRLIEIATALPDNEGRFAFRFTPEYEGLYSIGTGNALNQQGVYRFYFKGDDILNLRLVEGGYELIGENSKENEALYIWDKQSKYFKDKGTTPGGMSTYVDFFPEVETFKNRLLEIAKSAKTGNAKFDTFFKQLVDFDFAYYVISYLYMPRTAHPSKEEMSDYYLDFDADRYLIDDLMRFPYGDRFITNLLYRKLDLADRPTLEEQVEAIPSDLLRGQYVLQRLEGVRSYSDFQEINKQYKKYFTLPEQIQRVRAVETKLIDTKTGVPAFNFNFPDINGKEVSLASLNGKVVLVDIWATWCGPCKAEEPHWEKLNEEFAGQDIAFVGVSVDKNKDAWQKYVPEKELKGIQLHAGSKDPLSEAYKVTGIPRYILIDKDGNLITADSPRPSDPKLKSLIEEWLKK